MGEVGEVGENRETHYSADDQKTNGDMNGGLVIQDIAMLEPSLTDELTLTAYCSIPPPLKLSESKPLLLLKFFQIIECSNDV